LGSLNAPPDPLAGLRGTNSKEEGGRRGKGERARRRGDERNGRHRPLPFANPGSAHDDP